MTATYDIEVLREKAAAAGDLNLAAICDRALGATRRDLRLSGRDKCLPREYRGRGGMSRAATECTRIIAENRAKMEAYARDVGSDETDG